MDPIVILVALLILMARTMFEEIWDNRQVKYLEWTDFGGRSYFWLNYTTQSFGSKWSDEPNIMMSPEANMVPSEQGQLLWEEAYAEWMEPIEK